MIEPSVGKSIDDGVAMVVWPPLPLGSLIEAPIFGAWLTESLDGTGGDNEIQRRLSLAMFGPFQPDTMVAAAPL